MKIGVLKPLLVIMAISFILVFGGWLWSEHLFGVKSNEYLNFVGAIFWWMPGVMILSVFVGGWAVIHIDRWIHLTPIISFVFWVVICWGIRKIFLILKKTKKNDSEFI
jgi:hypothetical protein